MDTWIFLNVELCKILEWLIISLKQQISFWEISHKVSLRFLRILIILRKLIKWNFTRILWTCGMKTEFRFNLWKDCSHAEEVLSMFEIVPVNCKSQLCCLWIFYILLNMICFTWNIKSRWQLFVSFENILNHCKRICRTESMKKRLNLNF